jgi:hypothetical protein
MLPVRHDAGRPADAGAGRQPARRAFTPEAVRKANLPVTLIQGGIHAGEIDGKDAGFLACARSSKETAAAGALDRQVLLFVPVFNVDGHERFAKWNRPNQRGPVEMGWRTTAQNFNLNRDYVKADAPEMQAMLALVNAWDPLTYVDLHVTDGAMFQHDVSIQVEPVYSGDPEFRKAGLALRTNVIADITQAGLDRRSPITCRSKTDDPTSGFVDGVSDPRFSTGYFQLRNRMAMLVETHSWKDYPTRVRITHNAIVSVLKQVAPTAWNGCRRPHAADARAARIAGQPVVLTTRPRTRRRWSTSRAMPTPARHVRRVGHADDALRRNKPQVWHVPLRDEVVADLQVQAPGAGYVVPAAWALVAPSSPARHRFRKLDKVIAAAQVETFRADKASFGATSFESHQRLTVEGSWKPEPRASARARCSCRSPSPRRAW